MPNCNGQENLRLPYERKLNGSENDRCQIVKGVTIWRKIWIHKELAWFHTHLLNPFAARNAVNGIKLSR